MNSEILAEIQSPASSRWLPDLVSRLQCPDCTGSRFTLYYDESLDVSLIDSAAIVCETCHACYPYARGVLNILPERPEGLTIAQRSNFSPIVARWYTTLWRTWSMRLLAGKTFDNATEASMIAEWTLDSKTRNLTVAADLGTAHGLYAIALAQTMKKRNINGYVIAIDFSPVMLQQARRAADKAGVTDRILWFIADVENLPLKSGAVNFVTDGGTLNEYADERTALTQIRRIMQDGGTSTLMHLLNNGGRGSMMMRLLSASGLRFPSGPDWIKKFNQAGLIIEKKEIMGHVMFTKLAPDNDR